MSKWKKILYILFFLISEFGNAQITFQKSIQSGLFEPFNAAQLPDSSYLIMGQEWGFNTWDGWICRVTKFGNVLWDISFDDIDNNELVDAILTTDGNIMAAGWNGSSNLLVKLNLNGDTLWTRRYYTLNGGGGTWSIRQTTDNGFITTGATNYKVCLIKTDSIGNLIWSKSFGRPSNICSGLIAYQTYDGGYILLGQADTNGISSNFLLKTDSIGNLLWSKCYNTLPSSYSSNFLKQTNDGGFIITGYTSQAGLNYFLLKTDINGDTLWTRYYDYGANSITIFAVQQTTDDGYIVAGSVDGDVYVMKADSSGNVLWSKTYDGGGIVKDMCRSIIQTNDGGFFIVGQIYNANTQRYGYIIKTDSMGNTCGNQASVNTVSFNQSVVIITPNTIVSIPNMISNATTLSTSYSATSVTICITTGIEESANDFELVNIYPNPFSDNLTISSKSNEPSSITLYDITSRIILQQSFTNTATINTSQLANGIYIYEVRNKNGIIKNGKVIKQ